MNRTALASLILLAGCAHVGMPIPIGKDTYMITGKSSAGIFKSGSDVKIALYKQASQYCVAQGLRMEEVTSTSESAGLARVPSAELHFKCVTPSE